MPAANVALLALCAVSFAWHAVASKTRFRTVDRTPLRMRIIGVSFVIGAAVNLAGIAPAPIGPRQLLFAAGGYAVALGLFAWACAANRHRPLTVAFSTDVPAHLVTTGPYRFMRHPFYTAYCLTWLAGAVASGGWLTLAVAAAMIVQYIQAARLEEAKFAASPLAERYRVYRARTASRLLPVLTVIYRL